MLLALPKCFSTFFRASFGTSFGTSVSRRKAEKTMRSLINVNKTRWLGCWENIDKSPASQLQNNTAAFTYTH